MFLMWLLSCFVLVAQLHSSVNSVDSNVMLQCENVTQAWELLSEGLPPRPALLPTDMNSQS